ncbi:MAG: hypothetical protein EOO01_04540 [Chitinophagaceae bacterium]|nr:MAG: hypothetical protein EOO01_04540 [Chitinophagaceae bacterium]
MSDNLKDILSHLNTDIDQETLLLYLQDKLPDHKKQDVERVLSGNEFAADAMDGLQQFDDKKKINHVVDMLNRDLKKKVEKKMQLREKMKLKDQPWLYAVVFIFIILIILCYMIIVRMAKD